jgi:hypothetical protein
MQNSYLQRRLYSALLVALTAFFQPFALAQQAAAPAPVPPTPAEFMQRRLRTINEVFREQDVVDALRQPGSKLGDIREQLEKFFVVYRDRSVQTEACRKLPVTKEQIDCLVKINDAATEWSKEHGFPERDFSDALGHVPFSEQALVADPFECA